MTTNKSKNKTLIHRLIAAGLLLNLSIPVSHADEIQAAGEVDQVSVEEKIQFRLAEIAAEARAADRAKNGYYVKRTHHAT